MKFNVSVLTALRVLKFCVDPIMCWPPPLSASKRDLLWRDVLWLVALAFPIHSFIQLCRTIRVTNNDLAKAANDFASLVAMTFIIFKMSMCRYHRTRLQILYSELYEFVKSAQEGSREKELLDAYMNRCGPFYTLVGVSSLITSTAFCCRPMFLGQNLPIDFTYPFEFEDSPTLTALLYAIQVVGAYQATSAVFVDFEFTVLIWFAGIRFELLAAEFQVATTPIALNKCIGKHQKLLASAKYMYEAVRYVILAVVTITLFGNICTGYQFLHRQPVVVLAQFIFMLSVMCMEVLMYAWPADNLMAASQHIAYAVYSSEWTAGSLEMLQSIYIVIMRAQKPVILSVGGFLPVVNLDFYGKYLTSSFSYFTTVQAMAG